MTEPEPLQQIDRTYVRFRQRKLSYFSGCDYFRLASHPRVIAALQTGVKKYGLNVAASRLTTGNHVLYRELEAATGRFLRRRERPAGLQRLHDQPGRRPGAGGQFLARAD